MRNHLWLLVLPIFAAAYFGACNPPVSEREPGPDLLELVRKADFVFEGEVIRVEYKNSLPFSASSRKNTVVNAETDSVKAGLVTNQNDGVLTDLGEVPHTFVTYLVAQPFKGDFSNTHEVTLRFAGGVNVNEKITRVNPNDFSVEESYTISEIIQHPQVDVGDRDFVFAHRNGQKACPLADCGIGRLRVLRAEGDEQDYVFDEWGSEVHQLEDELGQFKFHYPFERQIREVNTHFMTFPNGVTREFGIVNVADDGQGDSGGSTSASQEAPQQVGTSSASGVDRHHPIHLGPEAPEVIEQPSANTRITPEALTWMLVDAAEQLYPGGMDSQPAPVSVDIRDDFEIGYLRGEISSTEPVEQDRPLPPAETNSACARIEASVMAEASLDPATGRVREDADVVLSESQIQRIKSICAEESPEGERE